MDWFNLPSFDDALAFLNFAEGEQAESDVAGDWRRPPEPDPAPAVHAMRANLRVMLDNDFAD